MKTLIILSLELPTPEAVVASIEAIDPSHVPYFNGELRITVDPIATRVEAFLDADELDPVELELEPPC